MAEIQRPLRCNAGSGVLTKELKLLAVQNGSFGSSVRRNTTTRAATGTFLGAEPFRHVVIAEFPKFDPRLAIAENGTVGAKAVNSRMGEIGGVYR